MRIAVVGGGVSGNTAAWLLQHRHEVELFEAEPVPGGHTKTVDLELEGRRVAADTGFMVYNRRTYPHFCQLLQHLGIEGQLSDMSFSVHCERSGLEYQGSDLNGLFAQRSNLIRPSFYRMLWDIVRFNREAPAWLERNEADLKLGEYLQREGYGRPFIDAYLVPMGAAIWSSRPESFLDFPIRFLIRFMTNHGLLQLRDRPRWLTIPQGARRYVQQLLRPLGNRVHTGVRVERVRRTTDSVELLLADGSRHQFDRVVLGLHAEDALRILDEPTSEEREILGTFAYQRNLAVLHTDASMLPGRRRAWASWNYHIPGESDGPVAVTYDLNRLQNLGLKNPLLLTLNPPPRIRSTCVLDQWYFKHPVFDLRTAAAQAQRPRLRGQQLTHYCGAYWGYGFHEDGVKSAIVAASELGVEFADCVGQTASIGLPPNFDRLPDSAADGHRPAGRLTAAS